MSVEHYNPSEKKESLDKDTNPIQSKAAKAIRCNTEDTAASSTLNANEIEIKGKTPSIGFLSLGCP